MAPKFLQKSFNAGKCKMSLKLIVSRIKLLKNKGEAQLKQMKKDLALLLEAGQEQTARIKVEDLVRVEKTMAAYGIIEIYCELIVARLAAIESQKDCPIDLKEAIASVIFASPRCSDIPELQDARKHFEVKYGKIFTTAALELRADCGVHRTIIEKLSMKTPDGETKIKILTAIAREHNVKWDPAVLKEQFSEPHEDLLNGPNKFVSNNQIPWDSNNSQFQPPESHNNEAATKYSCNDTNRSSSSSRTSSTNMSTPVASTPMTSHPESRTSENKDGREDFRNSFWDESPPLNMQNWDVKFADATSAAQAAAESAERARIAAWAAAELSSRGKFTREYSTDSHKSPSYGCTESRYDDYGSAKSRASGSFSSDSYVTSIDENMAMHNPEKVKGFSQKNFFEAEVDSNWQRKAAESGAYHGKGSFKNEFSPSAPSYVSKGPSDDDVSIINLRKENCYPRKGFTEVESVCQNQWNMQTERNGLGVGSIQKQYIRSSSFYSSSSSIKNNLTTDQNIQRYGRDGDECSSASTGLSYDQRGNKQLIENEYSVPAFDKSNLHHGCDLKSCRDNVGQDFNSGFPLQGGKPPCFPSMIDPCNPKQQEGHRGYICNDNSGAKQRLEYSQFHVLSTDFPAMAGESTVPSQTNDLLPAAFRESDGLNFEMKEEKDNAKLRESSRYLKQMASTRRLSSTQTVHSPTEFSVDEEKQSKNINRNAKSSTSSKDSELDEMTTSYNQKAELNVVRESWKRHGPCVSLSNQQSPRHPQCQGNQNDSNRKPSHAGTSSEAHGRSEAAVSSEFSVRSRLSQLSSPMGESLSKPQNLTSESRENSESSLPDSSIKYKSSTPPQHTEISVPKESVKLTQSAAKLAPKPLPKVVASGSNENPKSASLTQSSTSRKNSLKIPSHVHPKLPDYDTIVAQFKSLRSS